MQYVTLALLLLFLENSSGNSEIQTSEMVTQVTVMNSPSPEKFHRKYIANPDLPDLKLSPQEAKAMLKQLKHNELMMRKLHDLTEEDEENTLAVDDNCLSPGARFATVNLVFSNSSSNFSKENEEEKSEQIRINKYYGVKRDRFYVRNSGSGILSFKFESDKMTSQATIRGEGWKEEYVLAKGDIYWSLDNNFGAQHAIEGQAFALQIQLVHYLKSAGSLNEASKNENGIIITSLFFEATGNKNPYVEPLSRSALSVGFPSSRWKQVHGPLDLKMLYPVDMSYISYRGRYINEPCVKNALWFVFTQPMSVSKSQLSALRKMRVHKTKPNIGVFSKPSTGNKYDKKVNSSETKAYLKVVRVTVLNRGSRYYINLYYPLALIIIIVLQGL